MTAAAPKRLGPDHDYIPDRLARRAESRSYLTMYRLLGPRVPQPPRGAATPAILVPGFISGDVALGVLARGLRREGHRTFPSGVGANLGCTDAMVERLLAKLSRVADAEERPVALVGHSRGGMIVNLAARRRPDLVAGVVVLAAPVTGTLSVAAHVRAQLELLFRLNRRGLAVIGEDCVTGECAGRVAEALSQPFPAGIPYTSVYSRSDAIIDWHTCLDPYAQLIEVPVGHTGMSTDPAVQRIVIERVAALSEATRS